MSSSDDEGGAREAGAAGALASMVGTGIAASVPAVATPVAVALGTIGGTGAVVAGAVLLPLAVVGAGFAAGYGLFKLIKGK